MKTPNAAPSIAVRLGLMRWSPATRVASGLVALMVALILIADLFTGFFPDRLQEAKRYRSGAATLAMAPVSAALRAGRTESLQGILASALRHEPQLVSAAVRTVGGEVLASVGDHAHAWTLPPGDHSSIDNLRTAIFTNGQPWGELQLAFEPALPDSLLGWLRDPLLQGMMLTSALGFIAFQLYLRRVLRYLDPNSAVPERVRNAFDTLTEGVLVLDPKGNIMLANRAFLALVPPGGSAPSGFGAAALPWLVAGLPPSDSLPWLTAMRDKRRITGLPLTIDAAGDGTRQLVLNCSPIDDGSGRVRGCLASFSDVTELHERTERLRVALDDLNASQREIEAKNEELTRQATRDPLTGCLNRRAFMQEADQRFAEVVNGGAPICCVMCDIDHFKSVNDQFGHASGDVVIQSAVKSLTRGLRVGDMLGRYGGEEFCILLPNTSMTQALEVAERLRADVDANVGDALRQPARPKVTMSFGVAQWNPSVDTPAALIDLADQALYFSKKNGRNRVTSFAAITTNGSAVPEPEHQTA
ncbi:hypothetical protein BH11PSE8_BH11PSE8_11710 [soil metagenome]